LHETRHDGHRLVRELPPGDAHDRKTARLKVGVAAAVPLEGAAARVKDVPVDLDDEPLLAPEKVDLVTADAHVAFGLSKPGRPHQREETPLGLGPRERRAFVQEGL
jgi:hypothetical protein